MVATMNAALQREWELFSDWSLSIDRDPMPTDMETITRFLNEFPAPISTHGRRIKAIRRAHAVANVPLEFPVQPIPRVVREGEEWADIPRALAHLPKLRYPIGLRGRRDAWLLVLVGVLGFSRSEARSVTESDIALYPKLTIRGVPVEYAESARACPRCAVTRWLRVVNLAAFGAKSDLRAILDPTGDLEAHDCTTGLTGEWRSAPQLVPAIDRYGWLDNSRPISLRSISAIVLRCQGNPDPLEQGWVKPVATGRFKDATSKDLADAYDDVDAKLAQWLLTAKEILGESDELLGDIEEIL